jgi:hypothetical protein
MDAATFKAAFEASCPEPSFERLVQRFNWALQRTDGEVFSAMAAVNELLTIPISYEAFRARMHRAL